ncbi:sphingosine kinase related protein [Planoprotostelium fungivorum]|uniref:Sphingosine kinase related protein n=1 Tax=Planoprotostelium fungivorum TaxID=1890364 RepID=A0A2P6MXK1_9EUKA|nr:sphingosine kinase related protein [Planoprotostelium fungivorum]
MKSCRIPCISKIFKSTETIEKEEIKALSNWNDKLGFEDELCPTILHPKDSLVKTDTKRIKILYNPQSGDQSGEQMAHNVKKALELNELEVQIVPLEYKGHAEELMTIVDLEGIDVIGVLIRFKVPVVMIPAGTGNSFSLELYGTIEVKNILQRIKRGWSVPIDIAHVTFQNEDRSIYLFNSIHWGMASKVLITAEKMRWMGNAIRYTTAAAVEIFKGHKTRALIKGVSPGGIEWETEDDYSVCIANMIQTAAKGMKLAPDARLNDGCIDVILIKTSNVFDLANVFQKFYDGTHKELDYVEQCKQFSIIPLCDEKGQPIDDTKEQTEQVLDIDGELKGIAPFTCTVIPEAILVIV